MKLLQELQDIFKDELLEHSFVETVQSLAEEAGLPVEQFIKEQKMTTVNSVEELFDAIGWKNE